MIEKYLYIINKFGVDAQLDKLREEILEFEEATLKLQEIAFNMTTDDLGDVEVYHKAREYVIEEMGDVLTLLTQFVFYYAIEKPELDKVMDYKLERTLQRIKEGYYERRNNS